MMDRSAVTAYRLLSELILDRRHSDTTSRAVVEIRGTRKKSLHSICGLPSNDVRGDLVASHIVFTLRIGLCGFALGEPYWPRQPSRTTNLGFCELGQLVFFEGSHSRVALPHFLQTIPDLRFGNSAE